MYKYLYGILIVIIFSNCSIFSIKEAKITPLGMLTESGRSKYDSGFSTYRYDYYMVEHYQGRADIYQYVVRHLDSSFLKLNRYDMTFYEKSSDVNIENIMSYPPNLRYKTILYQKPVVTYTWFNGSLCASCIDSKY